MGTLALALQVQRREEEPPAAPAATTAPKKTRRAAPEKIRILQINLDGWRSKAAILDNLAGETNPDVICI